MQNVKLLTCVHIIVQCAQLSYITQHRAVLIIFPYPPDKRLPGQRPAEKSDH